MATEHQMKTFRALCDGEQGQIEFMDVVTHDKEWRDRGRDTCADILVCSPERVRIKPRTSEKIPDCSIGDLDGESDTAWTVDKGAVDHEWLAFIEYVELRLRRHYHIDDAYRVLKIGIAAIAAEHDDIKRFIQEARELGYEDGRQRNSDWLDN